MRYRLLSARFLDETDEDGFPPGGRVVVRVGFTASVRMTYREVSDVIEASDVTDYVIDMNAGDGPAQLRSALLAAGFDEADVTAAIAEAVRVRRR